MTTVPWSYARSWVRWSCRAEICSSRPYLQKVDRWQWKVPFPPLFTRNPGKRAAFGAGCWDDRAHIGSRPLLRGLSDWYGFGALVRFSPSFAPTAHCVYRPSVSDRSVDRLAISWLCHLPRRSALWLHRRSWHWLYLLGKDDKYGFSSHFCEILAPGKKFFAFFAKKCKKTLCIWEKKGYNK